MASKDADYSNLVEVISLTAKVQDQVNMLRNHFNIESLTQDGCMQMPCTDEGIKILEKVREEFKKDFVLSKKITAVAIIPRPKKSYSLSSVRLLGFQSGPSELEELGGPDVCVILIPVFIVGGGGAMVEEPETHRQTDITFKKQSAVIINGRCAIWIHTESKIVCAMLCIGTDKG